MTKDESPKRWTEKSPYAVAVRDESSAGDRHDAPSARRNLDVIVAVLREVLPPEGAALEIASGTGQHVVAFAQAFPAMAWQPSDPDPQARASIAAWIGAARVGNVRAPVALDVAQAGWHADLGARFDAMLAINLLHIAPWSACEGLMAGAARLLGPRGLLYLYGAYKRDGRHTAPSNDAFDRSLCFRDPAWGVRDLEAVAACAEDNGLSLDRVIAMPANNFSVIFRRSRDADTGPPDATVRLTPASR